MLPGEGWPNHTTQTSLGVPSTELGTRTRRESINLYQYEPTANNILIEFAHTYHDGLPGLIMIQRWGVVGANAVQDDDAAAAQPNRNHRNLSPGGSEYTQPCL